MKEDTIPLGEHKLFLSVIGLSSVFATIVFYLVHVEPSGVLKFNDGRSTNDLLTVLIGVSGVTIPAIVGYVAIRERDLDIFILARVRALLSVHGIDDQRLNLAKVHIADNATHAQSHRDFRFVVECMALAKDEHGDSRLSEESKNLLFSTDWRETYEKYFENGRDNQMAQFHAKVIGCLALTCFCLLYIGHLKVFTADWKHAILFEHSVIIGTLAANVAAYGYLLYWINTRNRIRRRIRHAINDAVDGARQIITTAFKEKEDLESSNASRSAALTAAIEAVGIPGSPQPTTHQTAKAPPKR